MLIEITKVFLPCFPGSSLRIVPLPYFNFMCARKTMTGFRDSRVARTAFSSPSSFVHRHVGQNSYSMYGVFIPMLFVYSLLVTTPSQLMKWHPKILSAFN